MRIVTVTPYNEKWPRLYKSEASVLKELFGDALVTIHHIGSTSVPGLAAKPVIDFMPVARDITAIDSFTEEMQKLGYEAKGENGIPGRRYFQKGGDDRTHHVHIYEEGSKEILRHLAFRNYLRCHPEDAEAYGSLKMKLAERFPYDINSYIEGKYNFLKELEQKALAWITSSDRG